MKKINYFFIFIFSLVFFLIYIKYNDFLNRSYLSKIEKYNPIKINKKIIFVTHDFTLSDYNKLLDKVAHLQSSIIVFIPQIFNMKINNYLEDINLTDIENLKKEYRNFKIKLVSNTNIIPVVFLLNDNIEKSTSFDLTPFSYKIRHRLKLKKYNYAKIKSKRMFYAMHTIGFLEDTKFLPYKIPIFFQYKKNILLNASIEVIRKYYKLTKKKIKYNNKILNVGDIFNIPLNKNGEILIHSNFIYKNEYSLNRFLQIPLEKLENKIIIVRSMNNSFYTMMELGATISSIIDRNYMREIVILKYFLMLLVSVLLISMYKNVSLKTGFLIFIFIEIFLFITSYLLLIKNIYMDFILFSFINTYFLVTIYSLKIFNGYIDLKNRIHKFKQIVPEKNLKNFINTNMDIKIKDTWIKTQNIYINIEKTKNIKDIKKTFENVEKIIYNKKKEFLIKFIDYVYIINITFLTPLTNNEIIDMVLHLREKLKGKFNILLYETEIFISELKDDIVYIDKNDDIIKIINEIEKKKYIFVLEKEMQKYIKITKFQKILDTQKGILFNIVGKR